MTRSTPARGSGCFGEINSREQDTALALCRVVRLKPGAVLLKPRFATKQKKKLQNNADASASTSKASRQIPFKCTITPATGITYIRPHIDFVERPRSLWVSDAPEELGPRPAPPCQLGRKTCKDLAVPAKCEVFRGWKCEDCPGTTWITPPKVAIGCELHTGFKMLSSPA